MTIKNNRTVSSKVLNITPELHRALKTRASAQGISLQEATEQAVIMFLHSSPVVESHSLPVTETSYENTTSTITNFAVVGQRG